MEEEAAAGEGALVGSDEGGAALDSGGDGGGALAAIALGAAIGEAWNG